jgi:AraC-like DNA-binding protein
MQLNIDFSRAEQLATLRHAQLPATVSTDGKRIEPRMMLAILRCLDDHAGGKLCWVSFETLAKETGYSVRSCKRGIAALESLSLVCVETKCIPGTKTRVNHYRIVWSELLLLRRDKAEEATSAECGVGSGGWKADAVHSSQTATYHPPFRPDQSALGTDQSALGTDQSALGTDQSAPGGTLSAPEAPMKRSYGRTDGISWTKEEREAIDTELQAVGYDRRQAFVREFAKLPATEVLTVLAEYRGNFRLFAKAGPGVIPGRLRSGNWKVAGVKSCEELAAAAAEKASEPVTEVELAKVLRERQVWEWSRRRNAIAKACADAEERQRRFAAELPAWFLEKYVG